MTGAGAAEALPAWLDPVVRLVSTVTAADLSRIPVPAQGARRSAVLVLFGEGPAGPDLVVIERGASLRDHPGQPGLPGGSVDPGDEGPVGTALREAAEEIGLDLSTVIVLGTLPELYLPPSNFVVTPVLAFRTGGSADRVMDPIEVAATHRIPLAELTDPANRLRVRHLFGPVGPAFRVRQLLVWGFTGALLDGLIRLAGWELPWDAARVEESPVARAPG